MAVAICLSALTGCKGRSIRNDHVTCQSVHAEGRGTVNVFDTDIALDIVERSYLSMRRFHRCYTCNTFC